MQNTGSLQEGFSDQFIVAADERDPHTNKAASRGVWRGMHVFDHWSFGSETTSARTITAFSTAAKIARRMVMVRERL
jgi:hypothetical protein